MLDHFHKNLWASIVITCIESKTNSLELMLSPGDKQRQGMMLPLKMGMMHVREQLDTWKISHPQEAFEDEGDWTTVNPNLCLQN